MPDDRIILREVALRLQAFKDFRNSRSRGRLDLLGFLRSGELTAQFIYPSLKAPEIAIPQAYWMKIKSGDFQTALTRNLDSKRKGDYLVYAQDFAGQYASWLKSEGLGSDVPEIESAIKVTEEKCEVFVLESEWTRFCKDKGLDTVEHAAERPRPGKANDRWRAGATCWYTWPPNC